VTGHADAEAVEIEASQGRPEAVAVRQRRRRHVVEDSAVLVPDDEEQRRAPHLVARADRLVHVSDEIIPREDEVVGMLVGGQRAVVLIHVRSSGTSSGWQEPAPVGRPEPPPSRLLSCRGKDEVRKS
jgi:hypothetical protein